MSAEPVCTDVLLNGLKGPYGGPKCFWEKDCRADQRCFWRRFHELETPKPAEGQGDLFGPSDTSGEHP